MKTKLKLSFQVEQFTKPLHITRIWAVDPSVTTVVEARDPMATPAYVKARKTSPALLGYIDIVTEESGNYAAGEVWYVYVGLYDRRRGVATALWEHANTLADFGDIPKPIHSAVRTNDGNDWANAVGGYVPPRD